MLTHGLSDQGANGLPRLSPPYKGQLSSLCVLSHTFVNENTRWKAGAASGILND